MCCSVKILEHVLVRRLMRVLDEVVAPDQSAYVPGRRIFDASIFLRDLIWYMDKDPHGVLLCSLDQQKAFDSVSRPWMRRIMTKLGFGRSFLRWVDVLHADLKCNIIVSSEYRLSHSEGGDPRKHNNPMEVVQDPSHLRQTVVGRGYGLPQKERHLESMAVRHPDAVADGEYSKRPKARNDL